MEALKVFSEHLIAHPKLMPVRKIIQGYWPTERGPAEDIDHFLVYGHTRTGKTAYAKDLVKKHPRRSEAEADNIPVIWFRAPMPFTGKELYIQALRAYGAPAPSEAMDVTEKLHKVFVERSTEGALKRRLFHLAEQCSTRVWIIDDIQHAAYGRGTEQENLDRIKHLADEAGVMLILMGTFEAVTFFGLNGQLTGRFRPVRLDRYAYDSMNPDSIESRLWKQVLAALDDRLPFEQRSHLCDHAGVLFRYTLGLIGLLKPLLRRCLRHAIDDRHKALAIDLIDQYRLPDRQLAELEEKLLVEEARDKPSSEQQHEEAVSLGSRRASKPAKPKPRRECGSQALA